MKNTNLMQLRNGNFEVEDFDGEKMIAVIAFDGENEIHNVRFFSEDVMDCAMSAPFNMIEGWDEPYYEGDHYRVHEYHGGIDRTVKVTFPMWWESVSGLEKEELIKSALMLAVDRRLRRITNEIEVSPTGVRVRAA